MEGFRLCLKNGNMRGGLRTYQSLDYDAELDCVGNFCPMPIARTKEAIEKLEVGQVLKMRSDDSAAEENMPRWAKRAGHEVVKLEKSGDIITFWIRRKK